MRRKEIKAVLTFDRTVDAMAMESACQTRELPGRLIPIPTEISAGCGLCWMVQLEDQLDVDAFVREEKLACGSWHQVLL